ACLMGLLAFDARRYLPSAARLLEDEHTIEAAALALGESRLIEALPLLRNAVEEPRPAGVTRTLLLAAALMRRDEATDWLLEVVRTARESIAVLAVRALAVHRDVPDVAARARKAAEARGSGAIAEEVEAILRE